MRGAKEITSIKVKLEDKDNIICPVQGIWITERDELFLKVEVSPGATVNYKIGSFNSDFLKIEK